MTVPSKLVFKKLRERTDAKKELGINNLLSKILKDNGKNISGFDLSNKCFTPFRF